MAEVLLINPRKRAKKTRRKTVRRANPAPAARRRVARRRNPAPVVSTLRRVIRRRRPNPITSRRVTRRRRNPIGGGSGINAKSIVSMLKESVIGGAGAVAVDLLMAKVGGYLPASMRITDTKPSVGHAVKALLTVVAGKMLKKPTRGLSEKMAQGALTVQMNQLITGMLPASMTGVASVGYWNPAGVVRGSNRIGPIRNTAGVGAYTAPGQTALLSAYQRPGGPSALLSGRRMSPRAREGAIR